MAKRNRHGGQAESKLNPEQHQNGSVGKGGIHADSGIEQAAVEQHRGADEGNQTRSPATIDRQSLLPFVLYCQRIEDPYRHQQADDMAEQHEQHARPVPRPLHSLDHERAGGAACLAVALVLLAFRRAIGLIV